MTHKLPYFLIGLSLIAASFGGGWYLADRDVQERQSAYELQVSTQPYPELSAGTIAAQVNAERAKANLPALTYSTQLEQSACAKADDMIAHNYWAHTSPTGTTPWYFFDSAGYNYFRADENLAYGQRSDTQVVTDWLNSPTHRSNLMGEYAEQGMCVRYAKFQGVNAALIVNHFGAR